MKPGTRAQIPPKAPFPAAKSKLLARVIRDAIKAVRSGEATLDIAIAQAAVNGWMEGHLEGHKCSKPCPEELHAEMIRLMKEAGVSFSRPPERSTRLQLLKDAERWEALNG